MIRKIYSKIKPAVLLTTVYPLDKNSENLDKIKREEITEPEHFLQAMSVEMPAETEIKAHKHLLHEKDTKKTHEAILVLEGSIELSIYDLDDSLVEKVLLKGVSCSVTLNGGHSLKAISKARFFEFKNGPYKEPERDRAYF